MNNNRGQALVEFIMVVPILIMIMMAMVDFGNIIIKKYQLESELDDISNLYIDGKSDKVKLSSDQIKLNTYVNGEYTKITLDRDIDIITPGLNLILGEPYKISTSKYIYIDEAQDE